METLENIRMTVNAIDRRYINQCSIFDTLTDSYVYPLCVTNVELINLVSFPDQETVPPY